MAGRWVFAGGAGAWLAFRRLLTNLRCRGTPVSELGPDLFDSAGIPVPDRYTNAA
jgi:hypothetical protein